MLKGTPSAMNTTAESLIPSKVKHGLVLASASPARRALLEGAGLEFGVAIAGVDEGAIRDELLSLDTPPDEIATALAQAKAEAVTKQLAGHLDDTAIIIGADQVLVFEGEIFEKPKDCDAACETLKTLRGKTHQLISAAVGYRAGGQIWSCRESARLTMRDFSDDFLDDYLRREEGHLASVGAYRLEGLGAQLFSHIEGDFFTILGLPLLALLGFLRREGLVSA